MYLPYPFTSIAIFGPYLEENETSLIKINYNWKRKKKSNRSPHTLKPLLNSGTNINPDLLTRWKCKSIPTLELRLLNVPYPDPREWAVCARNAGLTRTNWRVNKGESVATNLQAEICRMWGIRCRSVNSFRRFCFDNKERLGKRTIENLLVLIIYSKIFRFCLHTHLLIIEKYDVTHS